MTTHMIQRGETLSQIAAQHGTSIRRLMKLNRITDPHHIRAGERLKMPADAFVPSRQGSPSQLQLPSTQQPQTGVTPPPPPRPVAREDRALLQSERPRRAAQADIDRLAGDLEAQKLNPKSPFMKEMVPAALAIERKYGLPAKVILAQAALESNWGKAAIGKYNVFGIKGRGSQGSISVSTREHIRGRWIRTRDNFAHYGSYQEAFEAYAKTLHNGRYGKALANKSNPVKFAQSLQGVYATDPGYAGKLISIMRKTLGL